MVGLVEAMRHMAFSARDLARAADIYDRMLRDNECGIILCLAGSLVSAGLKKVFVDMIRNRMVDAVVSTGANIVDQDFFEGLGFKHYIGRGAAQGRAGRRQAARTAHRPHLRHADRRGRTAHLRRDDPARSPTACRRGRIRRASSSARWAPICRDTARRATRIVLAAYEARRADLLPGVFSDCSAGFGLVAHQHARGDQPKVSIDSAKDFYELTQLKIKNPTTGLFMIGGGVPKNFAQDIVVAADILGHDAPMHKYAVQITVADVRDGALSS